MLMRILILMVLALTQAGCSVEEGVGPYRPTPMTNENRDQLEELKREFLRIEDLRVGNGPLLLGVEKLRPISRFAILIAIEQTGIWLGLNGMAVGGKRRITIQPKLVYGGPLIHGVPGYRGADVRKDTLIVEVTLTSSCIPTLLRAIHLPTSRYMIEREVG
jgi:hypothetical protein